MEVVKVLYDCGCKEGRKEYGVSYEIPVYGGFSNFTLTFIVNLCDMHTGMKQLLYCSSLKNKVAEKELNTPDGKKWRID